MKRKIVTGKKRGSNGAASAFDLLFLLTSVYGLLFLLHSMSGVWFHLWLTLLASTIPGILLWFLRRLKKTKALWSCFSILMAACFASLAVLELRTQLGGIWAVLTGTSEAARMEVTGAALFLATLISLAVFLLELIFRTHWPMYLLTTLALLAFPLLGTDPGIPAVFLLFAFQIAFWAINGALYKKRNRLSGREQRPKSGKIKAAAVLLSGVFLASLLAVQWNAAYFFQAAYGAEGFLQRTIKQISGIVDSPNDGTVSRGNLYPAGTEQLEVRTDQMPTETLYLKGFSGGEYNYGEWQPADDETVFEQMRQNTLHWGQWGDLISGLYDSMYFVMNSVMQRREPLEARNLWVQRQESVREWYVPYYGMWDRRNGRRDNSTDNGYHYQYYERSEIQIDWQNIPENYELNRDWYYDIQGAYLKEIEEAYTSVPEENLPRLVQLCEENPAETPEQATALILSVLQNGASYTQTPGLFPMNQDPVEYFLFEGQEGYCQHFASAAVLMYRLYGIPARYAAGYAVFPSMFTQQEDGIYLAVVTDESAHAWPEIFLEDYGWVPIEVTPSSDDVAPVYPGMDEELLEGLLGAQNWNMEPLQQTRAAEDDVQEVSPVVQGSAFAVTLPSGEDLAKIALCVVLVVLAAFLPYRTCRLRAIEKMDVQRLFVRMMKAMRWAGLLKEYAHNESEFVLHLPEVLPGFTYGQAQRLLFILQKASFGKSPVELDEENEVREMYRQMIKAIYGKLPLWKKPLFQFVSAFL